MKKTIWYSIINGGDGSAYPRFMESERLTEWDQDHMDEGWGETCNGSIEMESDSEINILTKIETELGYFLNLVFGYNPEENSIIAFAEEFFEGSIPEVSFQINPDYPEGPYHKIIILDSNNNFIVELFTVSKKDIQYHTKVLEDLKSKLK